LERSCGYYVLLEGGREDQLARCWMWFWKTSGGLGKEKKKKRILRTVKKDLGKYSRERKARDEREERWARWWTKTKPRPDK